MKKKLVKKIFVAQQYEGGAIETFLENMAEQGYWFVKMQGIFFYFEPCEPKKVRFQVDYFDKASIIDTNPEEKTLEYIEYCKECGWEHVFSSGKMQIFRTEDENAPDIHTDDAIKLKYIMKNALWLIVSIWIPFLSMMIGALEIFMGTRMIKDMSAYTYAYQITNLSRFFFPVFFGLYTLYILIQTVRIVKFYAKNKKRVQQGLPIEYYSYDNVKKFGSFSIAYLAMIVLVCILFVSGITSIGIFMFVFLLVELGIIIAAVKLTQHKRANRISNVAVIVGACAIMVPVMGMFLMFFLVFGLHDGSQRLVKGDIVYVYSVDELPFTLEQMGVEPSEYEFLYEEKDREINKTPWATYTSYWNTYISEEEGTTLPYWSADIFQSRFSDINEEYRRRWFQDSDYSIEALSETIVKQYGAEEGYKVTFLGEGEVDDGLLLVCGKKTIYITGNFEDTQENTELLKQLYQ